MEEIIKKIKEKGYERNKELSLELFNELRASLRHEENIFTALASIFMALLVLPEKEHSLLIFLGSFLCFFGIKSYFRYLKTIKLLKRLIHIISEDPMDDEKEALITGIVYVLFWIIGFLLLIFF